MDIMIDTGAYVSVAPQHFAPEIPLLTVDYDIKLLTATDYPMNVYSAKTVLLLYARFYINRREEDPLLGLHNVLQKWCTTQLQA